MYVRERLGFFEVVKITRAQRRRKAVKQIYVKISRVKLYDL